MSQSDERIYASLLFIMNVLQTPNESDQIALTIEQLVIKMLHEEGMRAIRFSIIDTTLTHYHNLFLSNGKERIFYPEDFQDPVIMRDLHTHALSAGYMPISDTNFCYKIVSDDPMVLLKQRQTPTVSAQHFFRYFSERIACESYLANIFDDERERLKGGWSCFRAKRMQYAKGGALVASIFLFIAFLIAGITLIEFSSNNSRALNHENLDKPVAIKEKEREKKIWGVMFISCSFMLFCGWVLACCRAKKTEYREGERVQKMKETQEMLQGNLSNFRFFLDKKSDQLPHAGEHVPRVAWGDMSSVEV